MIKPVKYDNFLGIDTFDEETRLKIKAGMKLLKAKNVDIFPDGHISRRKPRSQVSSTKYQSLWSNDIICLGIYGGNLVKLSDDLQSRTVLMPNVGESEMVYETVYDDRGMRVYFTNNQIIGKVRNNIATLLPPFQVVPGRESKKTLPAGNILRYFDTSLYVVRGKILYISDVINKDIYDLRYGFKQFETEITMLQYVKDGLFISDSDFTYFMLRGPAGENAPAVPHFILSVIDDHPVTPGTDQKMSDVFSPVTQIMHKEAVFWRTERGLYLGGEGGMVEKITEGTYVMPPGIKGASLIKRTNNLNQYLTVIQQ
jgi:hypothetical protein